MISQSFLDTLRQYRKVLQNRLEALSKANKGEDNEKQRFTLAKEYFEIQHKFESELLAEFSEEKETWKS